MYIANQVNYFKDNLMYWCDDGITPIRPKSDLIYKQTEDDIHSERQISCRVY